MADIDNLDYHSDDEEQKNQNNNATKGAGGKNFENKPNYSSIYLSGFKDLLLKEELQRALKECGFEHPSEVQQECIPNAIHGKDILCQAKSGMGKTAVFVLSILNMMEKDTEPLTCLVIANTRELADQIDKEFKRLGRYLTNIKS
jgi:ATP-dependent RNA helicase UAP56/SUB2